MDEAMHPLTLLAVGLYGEVLPNQNGAPIRLVVPWKYGFKGIKSIVAIRFIEKQPLNTWEAAAAAGVRLLRQREPDGRSPALEPGERAAPRRVLPPQDADVQRLRRSGGVPLHRHGSAEELLKRFVAGRWSDLRGRRRLARRARSPRCFTNDTAPIRSTTSPIHRLHRRSLRSIIFTLAVTPLRRLTARNELIKLRRMLGLFAFSMRACTC